MLGFFRDVWSALREQWAGYTCLRWYWLFLVLVYAPGLVVYVWMFFILNAWIENSVLAGIPVTVFYCQINTPFVAWFEGVLRRRWPLKPEAVATAQVDLYSEFLRTQAPHTSPRKR